MQDHLFDVRIRTSFKNIFFTLIAIITIISTTGLVQSIVFAQDEVSQLTEDAGGSLIEKAIERDGRYELVQQRTETTKSYLVPSDSVEREYDIRVRSYTNKIHYNDNGSWDYVDSTIVPSDDSFYAYENAANDFSVYFGETFSQGLRYIGNGLDYSILGVYGLSDRTFDDVIGEVEGNAITYPEVLEGVDVRYLVNAEGFTKEIVIKNEQGLEYDWSNVIIPIQSNRDLQVEQEGSISILGLDDVQLSPVVSFDEAGEVSTKDSVELNAFDSILILKPEISFLQDESREFPIIIDPGTQTKQINQDTFVSTSTQGTPQGGKSPRKSLFSGNYYDGTIGVWYYNSRSLLQFTGIDRGVRDATVSVFHYGSTGGGYTSDIKSYNPAINENTTVWNNQPSYGSDYGDISFPFYSNNFNPIERRSTDITALINAQLGSGSVRLAILSQNENIYNGAVFCSKDHIDVVGHQCWRDYAPFLEYTINFPPAPPTAVGTFINDETKTIDQMQSQLQSLNAYHSGECDESVEPRTGVCRDELTLRFRLDNVQDGDHDSLDINQTGFAQIQISPDNVNFGNLGGLYGGWPGFCCTQHTIARIGDYQGYWGAVLMDTDNQYSQRSNTLNFTVDTTPASVPVMPELNEYSPGFQNEVAFGPSTDNISPESNISYSVQVATDPEFENVILEQWQDGNPTIRVGGLKDGETYYYRAKSRDRTIAQSEESANISAWSNVVSSIQDGVIPEVRGVALEDFRFSPSNPTSVDQFDTVTFEGEAYDKHLEGVRIKIENINGDVVRTLQVDITPPETMQENQFVPFTGVWDGRNDAGEVVPDGSYTLKVEAYDKAGNSNDELEEPLIVIKDDTGAAIAISSPVNNYWTNQDSITLSGQVAGFNRDGFEDADFDTLTISTDDEDAIDITDAVDENNIFEYDVELELGENSFELTTQDMVANRNSQVGNPSETTSQTWVINYETNTPELEVITPNGLVDSARALEFRVSDSDEDLPTDQISGFTKDQLEQSLSISLHAGEKSIDLIDEGTITLEGVTVSCEPEVGTETFVCSVTLPQIEDAQYQVLGSYSDRAGNTAEIEGWEFSTDTRTFVTLQKPQPGSYTIQNTTKVSGYGEPGAMLELDIQPHNQKVQVVLEEDAELVVIDDNEASEVYEYQVTVSCGDQEEVRVGETSIMSDVCRFDITVPLITNTALDPEPIEHTFTATINDEVGNTARDTTSIISDVFALDLSITPNLDYFSPNGDGFQDQVLFDLMAQDSTIVGDETINTANPSIDSFVVTIADSSGNPVGEFSGQDVPDTWLFEGKDQSGNWLVSGEYQYSLSVTTTAGVTITTTPQVLSARSTMDGEIVITSPQEGYVTTRGVLNVMGQAPANQSITISVLSDDTIQERFVTESDENGFYSAIVTLPQTDSTAIYTLQASIQAITSNQVPITYDIDDTIFEDVTVTPTFRGINSEEEIRDLIRGQKSVNDLKTIQISSEVKPNVRGVDIDYADYTNMNMLPDTDPQSGLAEIFNEGTKIANISDLTEDDERLNPDNDPAVKKDIADQGSSSISTDLCEDENGCTWKYNYPTPFWINGGTYEIQLQGFKGESSETMSRGFTIDGRLASSPAIIAAYKHSLYGLRQPMKTNQGEYYSNTRLMTLYGAADPNAAIRILSTDQRITIDTTANNNGLFRATFALPDQDARYEFNVIASLNDEVSSEAVEPLVINLDRVAPQLQSVTTMVPESAINPWTRTGTEVEFSYTTSEAVHQGSVLTEDMYISQSRDVISNVLNEEYSQDSQTNTYSSKISVNSDAEGEYYSAIFLEDFAGNNVLYSNIDSDRVEQQYDDRFYIFFVEGQLRIVRLNYEYLDPLSQNEFTVALPETYPYSIEPRGATLDMRLFIDNTRPDQTEFELEGWGEDDGIYADGDLPEVDRLLSGYDSRPDLAGNPNNNQKPVYVIRGNTIELSGYGEANQRVRLYDLKKDALINSTDSQVATESCEDARDQITGDRSPTQRRLQLEENTIVQFSEDCEYDARFEFVDDGLSPDGIPQNWYEFQPQIVDLAGNESGCISDYSRPLGERGCDTVIIYHDTDNPDNHTISNIESESYNPIIDWNSGAQGLMPITKDTSITTTFVGERQSDVQYAVYNPQEELQEPGDTEGMTDESEYSTLTRNGDDGVSNQEITLGSENRDEDNQDCIDFEGRRRIGTCEDGIYTINTRETDSSGNISPWTTRQVERDTVRPATPDVSVIKNGNILAEYLGLTIVGEENARAYINLRDSKGMELAYDFDLGPEGRYQSDDLLGRKLDCGGVTYTVVVAVEDRAKNLGFLSEPKSITTSECPRCMAGNADGWYSPIQDTRVRITSRHRSVNPDRPTHDGLDMNIGATANGIVIQGNPIYPAKPGVVTYARYSYTDDQRWTPDASSPYGYKDTSNYVQVDHGDGYVTRYVHLQYTPGNIVNAGDYVDVNTVLGYMGNTGMSYGPHLHFTVLFNGTDVNPENYINLDGTNLSEDLYETVCDSGYTEGSFDETRWENSVMPPIELLLEVDEAGEVLNYGFKKESASQLVTYDNDGNSTKLYGISMHKDQPIKVHLTEIFYERGLMCDGDWSSVQELVEGCEKRNPQIINTTAKNVSVDISNINRQVVIRSFWNDTSGKHPNIANPYRDDAGNALEGGRWLTNNQLPGNSSPIDVGDDFEYDDTICTHANLYHNIEFTNNEGESKSISLNGMKTPQGCKVIKKYEGIEKPFTVTRTNPNWTWNSDLVNSSIQNQNVRKLSFDLVSDNRTQPSGLTTKDYYDGSSQVWIVIHGWINQPNDNNSYSNYMECYDADGDGICDYSTAATIARENPDDLVLVLDWREASGYGTGSPTQVNEAAKWITPTARSVKEKLNQWGLEDGDKLNFVGHSLGTLLSAEIAEQMGGANKAVLLDPASQLTLDGETTIRNYALDGNSNNPSSALSKDSEGYFKNRFKFSRAYTGDRSVAGSAPLSKTAHEAYAINFGSNIDLGDEHFRVIDVFDRMNNHEEGPYGRPLYLDYLGFKDLGANYNYGPNDSFGTDVFDASLTGPVYEGKLFVNSQPDYFGKRNKLEFAVTKVWEQTQELSFYYGTKKDDEIENVENASQSRVKLSSGSDIVNFNIKNKLVTVDNFKLGDKIKLVGNKNQYSLFHDNLGNAYIARKDGAYEIIISNGHHIFDNNDKLDSNKGLIIYI